LRKRIHVNTERVPTERVPKENQKKIEKNFVVGSKLKVRVRCGYFLLKTCD